MPDTDEELDTKAFDAEWDAALKERFPDRHPDASDEQPEPEKATEDETPEEEVEQPESETVEVEEEEVEDETPEDEEPTDLTFIEEEFRADVEGARPEFLEHLKNRGLKEADYRNKTKKLADERREFERETAEAREDAEMGKRIREDRVLREAFSKTVRETEAGSVLEEDEEWDLLTPTQQRERLRQEMRQEIEAHERETVTKPNERKKGAFDEMNSHFQGAYGEDGPEGFDEACKRTLQHVVDVEGFESEEEVHDFFTEKPRRGIKLIEGFLEDVSREKKQAEATPKSKRRVTRATKAATPAGKPVKADGYAPLPKDLQARTKELARRYKENGTWTE